MGHDYESWRRERLSARNPNPKKVELDPNDLRQADHFAGGSALRIWGYTDPRLLNTKHLLGEHREVHALLPRINGWAVHPEYARFHTLHTYPEPSAMAWRYREALHPPGTIMPRSEPAPPLDLGGSSIQGVSFLVLRHELLRLAMNERWRNEHQSYNHKTSTPLWLLTKQHRIVLLWYARQVPELGRIWPAQDVNLYWPKTANRRFKRAMFQIRFPHCILSDEYQGLGNGAMNRARALFDDLGARNIPAGADTPWGRDFSHKPDPMKAYLSLWHSWDRPTHHIHHRSKDPK